MGGLSKPLDCPFEGCDKKPRGAFALEQHIRSHTNERPFACSDEDCDKSFKSQANLDNHEKCHLKEKRIPKPKLDCPVDNCVIKCVNKSALERHMRTHTNERPYSCPEDSCNATFKTSDALANHIISHGTDTPYKCSICDIKFKLKHNLRGHVRVVHEDVKNYSCDFEDCEMRFTDTHKLEVHKRTHTGERPYCCPKDDCDKTFAHSSTLKYHINVHDGKKPYACPYDICSAAFSDPGSLRKHELCHLVEKPIRCPDPNCDATFTRNEHLQIHLNAFHTPEASQRRKIQEEAMKVALEEAGFDFKREHYINYRCTSDPEGRNARIDFMLIIDGVIVFLEVDENQHSDRSQLCECARMAKIVESISIGGNSLPVIFFRFNPHEYTVNGKRQYKSKKARYQRLTEELNSIVNFEEIPPMQIKYLYYDVNAKNELCCFDDEDYFEALKEIVTEFII